jgi:hypothetical protein
MRTQVLEKLVDLRRREGDDMARLHSAVDLGRFERAGLTVMPCTVHEFVRENGLLILDPMSEAAFEMLARLLHGGTWWDDADYQGSATLRRAYLNEAAGLLQVLYDNQQTGDTA